MTIDESQPPQRAASLILMRDRPGAPEILIVQRSARLAFAGGAYAFPGGRVDPQDDMLAVRCCPDLDPEDGAARIAAARETLEETAISIGIATSLDSESLDFTRHLKAATMRFDADTFTPFARWCPFANPKRRFDTRFYIARAAEDAIPKADGTETAQAFWATAASILARCEANDGFAIFPTRRLLERLARFATFAEAREEALRLPQRIITPSISRRHDGDWLQIPDDAGYPITAELLETALRS